MSIAPSPSEGETAATGAQEAARVLRGSAWLAYPDFSRSANRLAFAPHGRHAFIGLRGAGPAWSPIPLRLLATSSYHFQNQRAFVARPGCSKVAAQRCRPKA